MPTRALPSALPDPGARRERDLHLAVLPIAVAVGLLGAVFGAAARPVFGPVVTTAMSALVYSGAVQFTVTGLAFGGAAVPTLLTAAALVNSRNLALGAVLRPHLAVAASHRAAVSWFLIDEVVGLALNRSGRTVRTIVTVGGACYAAWVAGTVVGVLGGSVVPGLEAVASAVFPVLFVALAAAAATTPSLVVRSVAGAALTVGLALLWPAARPLAPVLAAALVALPAGRGGAAS